MVQDAVAEAGAQLPSDLPIHPCHTHLEAMPGRHRRARRVEALRSAALVDRPSVSLCTLVRRLGYPGVHRVLSRRVRSRRARRGGAGRCRRRAGDRHGRLARDGPLPRPARRRRVSTRWQGGGWRLATVPSFTARLGPITALGHRCPGPLRPGDGRRAARPRRSTRRSTGSSSPRDGPYRGHLTLARARGRGRLPSGLSGLPVVGPVPRRRGRPRRPRAWSRTVPCTSVVATFPLADR